MRCSKAQKYLSPYVDGELEAGKGSLLVSHVACCDRCAGELDRILQLRGLFAQTQRLSAPPAFNGKVMERISSQPAKGFPLVPVFIRFAEAFVFVLAITAGVMSGGILINVYAPHHKGAQVISSLSLETFETLPPDSMGSAYVAMTEERR
jgi:anti-sigma factor RsiW